MKGRYPYPVWGTQGGGLVREIGGAYIFIEKPECPGLDVGDKMPEMWGIIPANEDARAEMLAEENEWTEADMRQLAADFEMAVDMFEFALGERGKNLPNTDSDNVLERFKKSSYKSAKEFRF